ncbi:MAG: class I SAM-dependent methyltransferase [Acidimicrobiales bacterium]|jgi:ubiquinone/menaquinone biosynthesis C-methylase UbiE
MSSGRSLGFKGVSVPEAYGRFLARQLFEPWAADLVRRARLAPRASVLDVASGTGSVARLAARVVAQGGLVVASDISAGMLAVAARMPSADGSAPIEYLECAGSAIATGEEVFDQVLCQQGLQFFPDREACVREIHRVLRVGGRTLVSTWAAERPLGLFGPIAEALDAFGMPEPFPRAFDVRSYGLSTSYLEELLVGCGFDDVTVETVELDALWNSLDDAVATLVGTPFGPLVACLSGEDQERVRALLSARLQPSPDGTVTVRTASNLARGVKWRAGARRRQD